MPNSLGPTGLTLATRDELVAILTLAFQTIYGADINLDSDSPDGQLMNIFIQMLLDDQDLLNQINNMFDPDNAIGVILDQRVAINGIQRQAGTFTVTNVTIVTTQALNLYGLDQAQDADAQPVYTVADNAGNNWLLQTTQTIASSGSYVLSFQAEVPGAILTVPNTITVPVTIVLGVSSINNPTAYTTLGINEESDAVLKVRRQKSVALASQGYLAGLLAALENINGVTSAFVYENVTGDTDMDSVPGHSIWVIVAGTGANQDIATAIYTKRNAGCGMKGSVSYIITQVDGSPFNIKWDVVTPEDLFIKFTASSLDGVNPPNLALIRQNLPGIFIPGVFEQVNINDLATLVQDIDNNTLVTSAGFSTSSGGSYTNTLTPSAKNLQFIVSSANIILLPMILSPVTSTVAVSGTVQFTGLGGFGSLTYSISVNNSGGSINSSSGIYTAGTTPSVSDTVHVVDSLGNVANATVSVTT